jgi:type VI secretion system secreted protein VgrG
VAACPAASGFPTSINGMPVVCQPDGTVKVGNSIIIGGDQAYQAKVLADLAKIGNTPTGAALLNDLDTSGHTTTIRPTVGGNSTSYDRPSDRFTQPDGTPGSGSNSTINYDPNNPTIGSEPWETRPSAIGLAHEMIHADQAAHGNTTPGTTNNDAHPDPANPGAIEQVNTREVETSGIPPNDTRPINENKIRSEWSPPQPQRLWY